MKFSAVRWNEKTDDRPTRRDHVRERVYRKLRLRGGRASYGKTYAAEDLSHIRTITPPLHRDAPEYPGQTSGKAFEIPFGTLGSMTSHDIGEPYDPA